jgi:hypothetical protein
VPGVHRTAEHDRFEAPHTTLDPCVVAVTSTVMSFLSRGRKPGLRAAARRGKPPRTRRVQARPARTAAAGPEDPTEQTLGLRAAVHRTSGRP